MSLSRSELVVQLRGLGIGAGDVVMVHASLRAIGRVDGGATGLVAALERVTGPRGTIVMNLGARDDVDWVNARPEAERPMLLRGAAAFDKDSTPADPDVGVLAEVFRRLPGRSSTIIPTHASAREVIKPHACCASPCPGTTTTARARYWIAWSPRTRRLGTLAAS